MEHYQDGKKVFTFSWKIKNFSFAWEDGNYVISSPKFNIQSNGTSSWRLFIALRKNAIDYCLQKLFGIFPLICYEISFLDQKGSSLMFTQITDADFSTEQFNHLSVPMINETTLLPQGTLNIRLKLWEPKGSIQMAEQVNVITEIDIRRGSSFWYVEKFSDLKCGETRSMQLQNSSMCRMSISFNICQEEGEYLRIKVNELGSHPLKCLKCTFFLLDAAEKKVECGKLDIFAADKDTKPEWDFCLTMKKKDLLQDKSRFLPNDVLSFQCDFAFSTGSISEKIVQSEASNSSEKSSERLHTLREDLKSLYVDPILCDTKLQTATESFPAHSLILSARSPVFRALFTTDMKEKSKECVYIEDLDASTVRKMLLFIYSDTLEDMDWKSTKNLYTASDKYDIANLRHLCAKFLEKNLQLSNCCDALLLAYMHQDSKLMSSVQDFMSEHTKEILTSEEWRNLEKKYPLLTSETLRVICLKNLEK